MGGPHPGLAGHQLTARNETVPPRVDQRVGMTPRQAYALAHPITDPVTVIDDRKLYATRKHPRGFLIRSCLAVDR